MRIEVVMEKRYVLNWCYLRVQISETKIEVSPESKKGYPTWGLPRGTHLRNANRSCSRKMVCLEWVLPKGTNFRNKNRSFPGKQKGISDVGFTKGYTFRKYSRTCSGEQVGVFNGFH
jgi:hypothetical protein